MEKIIDLINNMAHEKNRMIIAIEGKSASGKTTLALKLSKFYDCNLFRMDDFFLRPCQRTRQRRNKPGGNVDYERFYEEVMVPLNRDSEFKYKPFSCKNDTFLNEVHVKPKKINIIEGVYSMHPMLQISYNFSVFLEIDEELQKERIRERDGEDKFLKYINIWIPMENEYFNSFDIKKSCDMII